MSTESESSPLRSNFTPGSTRWAVRRAQWSAMGISLDDQEKPKIAIVNTSSRLSVCFAHLDDVAVRVADSVKEAGGLPFEIRTTAPSDFVTSAGRKARYLMPTRDLVENGGFTKGDKLPSERLLAERLTVSRVAVREAMKVLEAVGKVEIIHGSGTYVRNPIHDPIADVLRSDTFDRVFLQHLIDTRAAIEIKVVEQASHNVGDLELRFLERVLDRLSSGHLTDREVGSLNVSFEAALAQIAGNPILARLQSTVHLLWVEAWGSLHVAPGSKQDLHLEHMAIFNALTAKDTPRALTIMSDHVDRFFSPEETSASTISASDNSQAPLLESTPVPVETYL